jgi:hypothetical protein
MKQKQSGFSGLYIGPMGVALLQALKINILPPKNSKKIIFG